MPRKMSDQIDETGMWRNAAGWPRSGLVGWCDVKGVTQRLAQPLMAEIEGGLA
jgi:hypothetical protein